MQPAPTSAAAHCTLCHPPGSPAPTRQQQRQHTRGSQVGARGWWATAGTQQAAARQPLPCCPRPCQPAAACTTLWGRGHAAPAAASCIAASRPSSLWPSFCPSLPRSCSWMLWASASQAASSSSPARTAGRPLSPPLARPPRSGPLQQAGSGRRDGLAPSKQGTICVCKTKPHQSMPQQPSTWPPVSRAPHPSLHPRRAAVLTHGRPRLYAPLPPHLLPRKELAQHPPAPPAQQSPMSPLTVPSNPTCHRGKPSRHPPAPPAQQPACQPPLWPPPPQRGRRPHSPPPPAVP